MGAPQFTPGPWSLGASDDGEVDAPGSFIYWHVIPEAGGEPVAIATGRTNDRMRADARLIAAAPNLHAALAELIEVYQDEERGGVPLDFDEQPDCIQRAMTALRLADGGA